MMKILENNMGGLRQMFSDLKMADGLLILEDLPKICYSLLHKNLHLMGRKSKCLCKNNKYTFIFFINYKIR